MLGQDPRVLDFGVAVRLIEYQVVPDLPPVDLVEHLRVPAYVTQLLEVFAALTQMPKTYIDISETFEDELEAIRRRRT